MNGNRSSVTNKTLVLIRLVARHAFRTIPFRRICLKKLELSNACVAIHCTAWNLFWPAWRWEWACPHDHMDTCNMTALYLLGEKAKVSEPKQHHRKRCVGVNMRPSPSTTRAMSIQTKTSKESRQCHAEQRSNSITQRSHKAQRSQTTLHRVTRSRYSCVSQLCLSDHGTNRDRMLRCSHALNAYLVVFQWNESLFLCCDRLLACKAVSMFNAYEGRVCVV
jgi:hypothetical protein